MDAKVIRLSAESGGRGVSIQTKLTKGLIYGHFGGRLCSWGMAHHGEEVADGSDATFAIKPGTHMEVLQVSDMSLSNDHIYIQVSGEPANRSPDFASDELIPRELSAREKFTSQGRHSGCIQYRADRFVLFLTRVWEDVILPAEKGIAAAGQLVSDVFER